MTHNNDLWVKGMFGSVRGRAEVSKAPQHTENLFGSLLEIAGRTLPVLERNRHGDCLCLVDGKYIVDVDYRDIQNYR